MRSSNMAAHTRLYNFERNISTNIQTLRQRTHLKLGELSSLFIVYCITFFDFIQCMTMRTIYRVSLLIRVTQKPFATLKEDKQQQKKQSNINV